MPKLLILILLASAATAGAAEAPPADLPGYLAFAAEHSPALAGERHKAMAMREDVDRAGALPELRLAWGEMVVPVETRVGPQQRILSVSQSLPWFGTLGLKQDAARAAADGADLAVAARRIMIERDVRAAWYRLAALEDELTVARASAALADEAVTWLRVGYEAGSASYAALLQAEMEAARLAVVIRDLEDRRLPTVAALNAAVGLPAGSPAPAAALPNAALLAAELPDEAALAGLLSEGNPELAALAARRESSRLGAEAAGKAAGPSLSVGLDYIMTGEARMPDVQDSGKDPVIARVSVGIPLWGGPQAESRAAAGRARTAGAELGERRLQLEARLEQGLYAWRDAGRRLDLQERILLPRTAQVIDVAAAAYAADQAAYGDLLAARRARLAVEGDRVRAQLDRALALNELAALVGLAPENLAAVAADAAPRPEERP